MRRPWGLRLRVLAATAVVAAVSLVTFGVLLQALQSQRGATARTRATNDAIVAASRLDRLALDLETGVRGFVLTGDESFLAPYERARQEFPRAGARLAAIPNEPDQKALVARLRADLYSYAAGYLAGVVRQVREGSPSARSVETANEGKARFDTIQTALDRFTSRELREQALRRADGDRLRERSIVISVTGLAVLLALIALIATGALRAIVVPVGRLQVFARELGAGRFGARLPESGPPETVELAHAFNTTAVNLERAEAELRRVSERHLAELDAVFREAPLGLAFVDRELRYLRINEALAEINERPAAEHLGQPVQHPDARAALLEVIEGGAPVLDRELMIGARTFLASYFPVRDDGELLAVGAAVSDVTDRRRAESARERLQAATAALAAAVSVADVARATVAEAGPALGTSGATLLLGEHDRLRLVEDHGLHPRARERWATIPLRAQLPAAECVRTGRAIFVADEAELLERWPAMAGAPRPPGARAFASLPLIASGRRLGALTLSFPRAMDFDEAERGLLEALAAQSAVALARAQLYEREHTVSRTLQASLLPRALPTIEGLDLAARLEAGAPGLDVGGDFYDAFALGDGAWGIAIGDVCGKGVDAAALTALARHTMRAAAHAYGSPGAVLEALNRAVMAESRPGQFLTAVFGRLTPRPCGGFRLVLAVGGHPPPVLLDADGSPRPLACAGTLLGVVEDAEIVEATVDLEPGDTLLLYTDGLTEAGAPERTLTTPEVAELLAAVCGETAAQTAEGCLASALEAGGGVTRDDIAVLVARVAMSTIDRREKSEQGIFDTGTMF